MTLCIFWPSMFHLSIVTMVNLNLVSLMILYNILILILSIAASSALARKRWLLAYTLIRNPALRELTANNLLSEDEDQTFDYPPETLNNTESDIQLCT